MSTHDIRFLIGANDVEDAPSANCWSTPRS